MWQSCHHANALALSALAWLDAPVRAVVMETAGTTCVLAGLAKVGSIMDEF